MDDEFDAAKEWLKFAKQYQVDLVACVSASERRGVLNDQQSNELGKGIANMDPIFRIAGLATFHDASMCSDKTVAFK